MAVEPAISPPLFATTRSGESLSSSCPTASETGASPPLEMGSSWLNSPGDSWSRTNTELALRFATAMSSRPSPSKSARTIDSGPSPVSWGMPGVKPPDPEPYTGVYVSEPALAVTKSRWPSPSRSPTAIALGRVPTVTGEFGPASKVTWPGSAGGAGAAAADPAVTIQAAIVRASRERGMARPPSCR